jgi:hypothetical protein
MSAPKTDVETQKRRHIVPLAGMALVVAFAVGLIVYWQFEEAAQGDSPGADAVDGSEARPNDATPPRQQGRQPATDAPGPGNLAFPPGSAASQWAISCRRAFRSRSRQPVSAGSAADVAIARPNFRW